MPIVHITWREGRTEDQKAKVVKGITDTIVANAGVTPDRVYVLIHDVPATNVGNAGRLFSQPDPDTK